LGSQAHAGTAKRTSQWYFGDFPALSLLCRAIFQRWAAANSAERSPSKSDIQIGRTGGLPGPSPFSACALRREQPPGSFEHELCYLTGRASQSRAHSYPHISWLIFDRPGDTGLSERHLPRHTCHYYWKFSPSRFSDPRYFLAEEFASVAFGADPVEFAGFEQAPHLPAGEPRRKLQQQV